MKRKFFTLTYDIVTESSAAHGDTAYNGYVTRDGGTPRKRNYIPKNPARFTLQEAVKILWPHSFESVECDSSPWGPKCPPHWINFSGSWGGNEYGESLSFSIHSAERTGKVITGASMVRLARFFRAHGERK